MWKALLAGTAALAIVGTSFVYAQQRPDRDGPTRWRPSLEDRRAFGEARLAALKAGLALTPEQEKHWPAFEAAARDLGKLWLERMRAREEAGRDSVAPTDPIDRLRRRADTLVETGAVLKRLAETADPLYKSLDDAQKRRFSMLARPFRQGQGFMHRGGFERGPDMGPGRGPMRRWQHEDDDPPRGMQRWRRSFREGDGERGPFFDRESRAERNWRFERNWQNDDDEPRRPDPRRSERDDDDDADVRRPIGDGRSL